MSTSQERQFQGVFELVSAGTAALTPAAVAANTTNDASTIAVPGCQIGDLVSISASVSMGSTILVQGEVQTAGVVTVKFANVSAASITPPAGNYTAICFNPNNVMFL
jgi:hypothetical protein